MAEKILCQESTMLKNFDINASSSKNIIIDLKNSLEINGLIYKAVVIRNRNRYIKPSILDNDIANR